ncbi:MAG: peptidyl-prolyl cis-trans isomerase [Myxococcales bacterium]|nr:peptidyl-prolyl cis-trans isomerase [Myxococcales bacterium]
MPVEREQQRNPARKAALRGALILALSSASLFLAGCDDEALSPVEVDAGKPPGGLTAEQARAIVAKVGDVTITLGDFAAALERMDEFNRLRYQTKERRRELLDQLVDMELLAQEAKRRGLDKRPEVQEAVRQILRETMLAQSRDGMRAPAAIPADEVQAYYDAHKDQFREPERRRVSVIVFDDLAKAKETLAKLAGADGKAWGEAYYESSIDAPKERDDKAPLDLAGDRGIVGPPGDPKGANTAVPERVRFAVFTVGSVGDIASEIVSVEGKHYIVRLSGKSAGHTRSVAEADRAIRVAILQDEIRAREEALEAELRKRFPVQVDEQALKDVKLPKGLDSFKPFWEEGPPSAPDAPAPDTTVPGPGEP